MTTALRRESGFTLIELMIVVSIIGILAAIAIPAYTAYVTRGNRSAARACASEMTQFMERYYTTNLTYVGAAPVLGCQTEGGLDTRYTLTLPGWHRTRIAWSPRPSVHSSATTRSAGC